MSALQFFSWMMLGAAGWGLFLIGVHQLVAVSERRKAKKRAIWGRRMKLATRPRL